MKNKVFRKVFGVFAVIIVIVLIYLFLPGQYKMPLKETFQSITMSWSEDVVKTLKNATVPNNSLTFGINFSPKSLRLSMKFCFRILNCCCGADNIMFACFSNTPLEFSSFI